jgi:uncharacterized protein
MTRPPGTLAQRQDITMAGTFELLRNDSGAFRFNLKAENGKVILTSESDTTKVAALNRIASVKANAPTATLKDSTG